MPRSIVACLVLVVGLIRAAASLAEDQPGPANPQPLDVEKLLAAEPVIPEGVVYKKGTVAENRASAIERLNKAFLTPDAKAPLDKLLTPAAICGAGLWQNIKDDEEMKPLTEGKLKLLVPSGKTALQLDGKLFQNEDELAAFWRAFRRKYPLDPKAIIRRPTPEELSVYWAMIPYDITEPIFVVETKQAAILTQFSGKEPQIRLDRRPETHATRGED